MLYRGDMGYTQFRLTVPPLLYEVQGGV